MIMAERVKRKRARSGGSATKATITKVRRKVKASGISVMDLVGSIKLTIDPVEFQLAIRDEW